MLTDVLRPINWVEVAGQKENVKILKAIAKNPEQSPKCLILGGEFGSGKTSTVRILARELNGITDPNYDLNQSPFYFEYDSTIIGNIEEIRKLRDVFGAGFGDYWKVVVFDEAHSVSQQAQTALLKVLEEVKTKTFFVFCTTHVHKVLSTIRSRSLELTYETVSEEDIMEHLIALEAKLELTVPQDIKELIAMRSQGHMRNVHMLLDKFTLVGEESFRETVVSAEGLFCDFFVSLFKGDTDMVSKSLNKLSGMKLDELRQDFDKVFLKCMKSFTGIEVSNPRIQEVMRVWGRDFIKLVRGYFSDWMRVTFTSDYHFMAGMLFFYHTCSGGDSAKQTTAPVATKDNFVGRRIVT